MAAAMLLAAGLRVVAHDAAYSLVCLNSFTLYVYLPAYVTLAFAVWRRRRRLAIGSLAAIACHLIWIAPDFSRPTTAASVGSAATGETLRLFFANANQDTEDHESLVEEVLRVDPDVVALAEFHPRWKRALAGHPLLARYPYGTAISDWQGGDVVVLSRRPVRNLRSTWAVRRAFIEFDIELGGQSLHFLCLHSPRPMKMQGHDYDGFWNVALAAIRSSPRPLVVVGGFNSTQHSRVYKQLVAAGLRSAHVDRGRGYAVTWPNGTSLVPPIRLDHVLVSPEVECAGCDEGVGAGSDHRPLIVELGVRPGSRRR